MGLSFDQADPGARSLATIEHRTASNRAPLDTILSILTAMGHDCALMRHHCAFMIHYCALMNHYCLNVANS